MLEDVSMEGQIFDEDFFAYREDGDLSWRAQLRGWRCVYTPYAVAYHVRRVFASNRGQLPIYITMQTPKNRFLMRIKNITPGLYRRVFIRTTLRDVAVVGFVLLREWSSLPGLWFVIKNWKRIWGKRRRIQSRRRISEEQITSWFNDGPTAFPLEADLLPRLNSRGR